MTRTLKLAVFLVELTLLAAFYCLFAVIITHANNLSILHDYEWVLMTFGLVGIGVLYLIELVEQRLIIVTDVTGDWVRLLFFLISALLFYDLYGLYNFIPGEYQGLPTSTKCTFIYITLGIYFLFKINKINYLRQSGKSSW